MSLFVQMRESDSPYIDAVMDGYTTGDGWAIRPAENHWHLVLTRIEGKVQSLVVGPWTSSGKVSYWAGAEIVWLRFRLGTFMPHLPARHFLNRELALPEAASRSFWLKSAAWEFPTFENAESFVARLVRDGVLAFDPVVAAALNDELPELASDRTVRHRFLHSTGLTQRHIRQLDRANQAAALLRQGVPILDTVHEAGYFDQPHLTRSLRQLIGYTPAQLLRQAAPGCDAPVLDENGYEEQHRSNVQQMAG